MYKYTEFDNSGIVTKEISTLFMASAADIFNCGPFLYVELRLKKYRAKEGISYTNGINSKPKIYNIKLFSWGRTSSLNNWGRTSSLNKIHRSLTYKE